MDLNKAQLLLDKINRLYKSMSLDPENVAPIEKDLMKDYIKLLYSAFLEDAPKTSNPAPKQRSIENISPTVVETPKVESPPSSNYQPPISTPPPTERVAVADHRTVVENRPIRTVPTRRTPPPQEQMTVETPVHVPSSSFRTTSPTPTTSNEEEEQLFTVENGTELSHKLGSLPISDLNKAMGINERIFTINELFRGDSRAFKHTINELNRLSSFAEAKDYLAKKVVSQFDWTNKQRRSKAKNFIKLIRRRYL